MTITRFVVSCIVLVHEPEPCKIDFTFLQLLLSELVVLHVAGSQLFFNRSNYSQDQEILMSRWFFIHQFPRLGIDININMLKVIHPTLHSKPY